jgi:hypothetical protein
LNTIVVPSALKAAQVGRPVHPVLPGQQRLPM